MKNILYRILIGICIVIVPSCDDDDFSPKSDFKELYTLNCIIDGNSPQQYATVLKSFDIKGLDPNTYNENPFISGSEIKLDYNSNEYFFDEKLDPIQNNTKYNFPTSYYTIDSLLIETEKFIQISAVLPNGTFLWSNTKIPNPHNFRLKTRGRDIPSTENKAVIFLWDYDDSDIEKISYLPKLNIHYSLASEEDSITHKLEVPLNYARNIPEYPTLTEVGYITFDNAIIDSTLSLLSINDTNKSNYRIINGEFTVHIFDKNLTSYYASVNRPTKGFAVIINEVEYTNIENGRGIFGSFITKKYSVNISKSYIKRFGYRVKYITD